MKAMRKEYMINRRVLISFVLAVVFVLLCITTLASFPVFAEEKDCKSSEDWQSCYHGFAAKYHDHSSDNVTDSYKSLKVLAVLTPDQAIAKLKQLYGTEDVNVSDCATLEHDDYIFLFEKGEWTDADVKKDGVEYYADDITSGYLEKGIWGILKGSKGIGGGYNLFGKNQYHICISQLLIDCPYNICYIDPIIDLHYKPLDEIQAKLRLWFQLKAGVNPPVAPPPPISDPPKDSGADIPDGTCTGGNDPDCKDSHNQINGNGSCNEVRSDEIWAFGKTNFNGVGYKFKLNQKIDNFDAYPALKEDVLSVCVGETVKARLCFKAGCNGKAASGQEGQSYKSPKADTTVNREGNEPFDALQVLPREDTIEDPPTATSTPTATPDPGGTPPILPAVSLEEQIIDRAKEELATALGIQIAEIKLLSIEAVNWPDSSLGCPASGMAYMQLITSGFIVILQTYGSLYEYHTDSDPNGIIVTCAGESGQQTEPQLPTAVPDEQSAQPQGEQCQECFVILWQNHVAHQIHPGIIQDLDAALGTNQFNFNGLETNTCYVEANDAGGHQTFLPGYSNGEALYGKVSNFTVSCPQQDLLQQPADQPTSSAEPPVLPASPASEDCPGAHAPLVRVGGMAVVSTRVEQLRVRSGPGYSNSVVAMLDAGETIALIGGPVCADQRWWWETQTATGQIGWVVEGWDNTDPYYILPADEGADPQTPTPTADQPAVDGGCCSHDANHTYWNSGDVTPSGWACLPGNQWEKDGVIRPGA